MSIEVPGLPHTAGAAAVSALFHHSGDAGPAPETKRRRIWELNGNLHCSIIGTCLTTFELRQVLAKVQSPAINGETDHQLHGRAVLLAAQRNVASKLLQKALDRRHRSAIALFGKARTADELRAFWHGAVARAEIPGAYWAVLTHPKATEGLLRQVFGEVHMLSHLVGAANRADIRRLRDLEADNSALHEKIARQQRQLHAAVAVRDASIARLQGVLAKAIAAAAQPSHSGGERATAEGHESTATLIAELKREVELERVGRVTCERRLQVLKAQLEASRDRLRLSEDERCKLREELDLAELALAERLSRLDEASDSGPKLLGARLLYVGGRAHQIAQLRTLAEQRGGSFQHHDGGIEDRSGLLEAQVARADLVFFPADCVSHNAVATVKRVSRQVGNSYVALRSSGLTSFAAALRCVTQQRNTTGRSD